MATNSTETEEDLPDLIAELCRLATIVKNDDRQNRTCQYINKFLEHFGKERCKVVGSSQEGTRIRANEDEGDFDFLIISEITVPITALVYRHDLPCFVHIEGEVVKNLLLENVDLIEERYLPSRLLKMIHPAAFTALRGVFEIVKLCGANIGRNTPHVQIEEECKPGLSLVDFAGLTCPDYPITHNNRPGPDTSAILRIYKQSIERSTVMQEPNLLDVGHRVIDVLQKTVEIADAMTLLNQGFGSLCKTLGGNIIQTTDLSNNQSLHEPVPSKNSPTKKSKLSNGNFVSGTYIYRTNNDFIGAFPLSGKPQGLDEWKRRENRKWPSQKVVTDIYENTEFFVVAKPSLLTGETDNAKDFSLAYNLAEIKLARALTPVQRQCLLMLKVYNKSYLKPYSKVLTTYHWKTAFYWKLEEVDPAEFSNDYILPFVRKVLDFMVKSLENKYLEFYFMKCNLFIGMELEKCREISQHIRQLQPVSELRRFIQRSKLDESIPILLPRDKVEEAWKIYTDPTNEIKIKALVSALEHIFRAIVKSKKYQNYKKKKLDGQTADENPVFTAILDVIQLAFEDMEIEKQIEAIEKGKSFGKIPVFEIIKAARSYLKAESRERKERLNYFISKLTPLIVDL